MVEMLDMAPYFYYHNYSCPRQDPAVDPEERCSRAQLAEELRAQIKPVNCVLVLSGMYVSYSDWIQKEIDIAAGMGKPIVGVRPWGHERIPQVVANAAVEIVGWNTESIVGSIRRNSI